MDKSGREDWEFDPAEIEEFIFVVPMGLNPKSMHNHGTPVPC
jgi:hypothetical protein